MHPPRTLYDITMGPGSQAPNWPGDPAFEATTSKTFEQAGYHSSALFMSAHSGTHIDSPGHIIQGAPLIDAYGPERFILPALVVDCGPGPLVGPERIAQAGINPGEALLIRTDNAERGLTAPDGTMRKDFTALSPEAAQAAKNAGASLVGIDSPSVDPFDSSEVPAHITLLGADILVMEWLDLSGVPEGRYLLACQPLKLAGVEASPVRALLMAS